MVQNMNSALLFVDNDGWIHVAVKMHLACKVELYKLALDLDLLKFYSSSSGIDDASILQSVQE
jgi:hypothetical protein